MAWPRAKYFPIQLSHSVNKYMYIFLLIGNRLTQLPHNWNVTKLMLKQDLVKPFRINENTKKTWNWERERGKMSKYPVFIDSTTSWSFYLLLPPIWKDYSKQNNHKKESKWYMYILANFILLMTSVLYFNLNSLKAAFLPKYGPINLSLIL